MQTETQAIPLSQSVVDETNARVRALAGRGTSIETRFATIGRIIASSNLDPDSKLADYRKEYIALLWKSKEISGQAQTAIAVSPNISPDFCGDVLTLEWGKSSKKVLDELRRYEPLKITLDSYTSTMQDQQTAARSIEEQLQCEIDQLNKEIKDMTTDIPIEDRRPDLLSSVAACALTLTLGVSRGILHVSPHDVRQAFGDAYQQGSDRKMQTNCWHCYHGSMERIPTNHDRCSRQYEALNKGRDELNRFKVSLTSEARQNDVPGQDEPRRRLMAKLEETQQTLKDATDLLKEIDSLKRDISSFTDEVQVFNDVYSELTSGSHDVISMLETGSPAADMTSKAATIGHIFTPLTETLALYARDQLAHVPEAPPAYTL
ncbi:hypothetical protein K435DRAFT_802864 [Dendrothele bispora CBS 962.96]|uniref:Uncharacterized protein n=1 Tax=Dendrothele bispora (strain CBS 962.96) TaxID=1314807 RepID=A0A4S8LKU7_DENBC|nr:hypothetical protein K435DRAFT_802864 [Dendrothele bispora CBS 962.96]